MRLARIIALRLQVTLPPAYIEPAAKFVPDTL
jgi:hypothetical protein